MTADLRTAARSDGSPDVVCELVTLEHDSFEAPIRAVNSLEEGFVLTSNGDDYIAYPFSLSWPSQDPDQPFAGAKFSINNVVATDGTDEPLVLAALRGLSSYARVRFMAVRASAPDVIEAQTTRLRLTGLAYDEGTISGTLELPDFNTRRAGRRFTPDQYPNLRAG